MFVLGSYVGVQTIVGRPYNVSASVALAVFAVIGGVAMVAVALALFRCRRAARAPVVLTQVLALPVGVSMLQGGQLAIGVALLTCGLAGAVLLFVPASNHALLEEQSPRT